MSSNPLQEAITRIKVLQEVLAEQPESWNPKTAPGKQVQRRNAEAEIDAIMDGFRKLVCEQAAKIYIIGEKRAKLDEARQVARENGGVVVEADELYRRLAAPAVPLYEQRGQVGTDLTLVLENDVMLACQTNKVTPTDFPRFPGNFMGAVLGDPEVVLRDIARTICEQVCGTKLQQALLTQLIFSETLRLEVTEKPLAIVIVGIRQNELDEFETRGFFAGRPYAKFNADKSKNIEGSLKGAAKIIMQQLLPEVVVLPTEEQAAAPVEIVQPQ